MNDLQKKLAYLGCEVQLVGHRHAAQIRLMVEAGNLKLIMSENHTSQSVPPYDFMEPESTSTFQNCLEVFLNPDQTIRVDVWEGTRGGDPFLRVASYTFIGDWTKYAPLATEVCNCFKQKTMQDIINLEAQERENRRRAMAERILKEMD